MRRASAASVRCTLQSPRFISPSWSIVCYSSPTFDTNSILSLSLNRCTQSPSTSCHFCTYISNRSKVRIIVSIVQNLIFFASKHVFFPEVATASVLQTQVPKLCADLDLSLLYILKLGTYSKFAWNNNFLASAFAFRSPARALAAGLSHQDHPYQTTDESFCFHNKEFDEIRCKQDSTENLRSFEKYPTPP